MHTQTQTIHILNKNILVTEDTDSLLRQVEVHNSDDMNELNQFYKEMP